MTNSEERQFSEWFDSKDLGVLEDVREYVEIHARQNAADVEADEELQVIKNTVEYYLDGNQEYFESYRN